MVYLELHIGLISSTRRSCAFIYNFNVKKEVRTFMQDDLPHSNVIVHKY